jgi:hypothetical protein
MGRLGVAMLQAQSELEPALRAAAAAGDVQQAEDVRHEAQAQLMVLYNR